jgi:Ca-activated chloride channel family protein
MMLALIGLAGDASAGPWRPDGADLVGRGREHYAAGRYAEALADFEAARALHPEDPRLSLAVGEALNRLQRYEDAAREFDRAVAQAEEADLRAEGLYNAGTNALASGDPQRAADLLRRSLRLDPDRADALTNLELALRQQQQQQQQQKQDQKQDQQKQDPQKQDEQQQDQQQQDQQKQDQQKQDQQRQDQQKQDEQKQDEQNQNQQKQDQQKQEQQKQEQQQDPQREDQPQDQASQKEGQPDQQQIDQERAQQILQALDRDEENLKRSVQQRLRGGKNKSGKTW